VVKNACSYISKVICLFCEGRKKTKKKKGRREISKKRKGSFHIESKQKRDISNPTSSELNDFL
jgi:hypothetical protein